MWHVFANGHNWLCIENYVKVNLEYSYVSPIGFGSADVYYSNCSSARYVRNIKIPTLCINAANDPISAVEGIPYQEFERNENLILALTPTGIY